VYNAGPADHPAVTPIDLPQVTALPQFGGDYRRSMLWGTYRPGLYFGEHPEFVGQLKGLVLLSGMPPYLRGADIGLSSAAAESALAWPKACACGCRSRCWRASCGSTRGGRTRSPTCATRPRSAMVRRRPPAILSSKCHLLSCCGDTSWKRSPRCRRPIG